VLDSLRGAAFRGSLRAAWHGPALRLYDGEVQVSEEALRALRDKYREIRRLRALHAERPSHEPRSELRALSARFPGALRELDQLPIETVEQRLCALEAALARGGEAPDWAALQIGYHGCMRAALRIKRWFAGRAQADPGALLAELRARYRPATDEPPLASFDRAALAAILVPPDGRLNPWVLARVAAAHGVEPERVQQALFLR
jgi:hypothetical protein